VSEAASYGDVMQKCRELQWLGATGVDGDVGKFIHSLQTPLIMEKRQHVYFLLFPGYLTPTCDLIRKWRWGRTTVKSTNLCKKKQFADDFKKNEEDLRRSAAFTMLRPQRHCLVNKRFASANMGKTIFTPLVGLGVPQREIMGRT
jgi:hypothetical protein